MTRPIRIPFRAGLLTLLALTVLSPPVRAQSNDTQQLLTRIERLERDIRDLKSQLYRGGGSSSSSGSSAAVTPNAAANDMLTQRIDGLEGELQKLTAQTEELQYKLDQTGQRMDRLSNDVDFRLKALEGGNKPAAPASADAVPLPPPPGAMEAPVAKPSDPNRSPPAGTLGTMPSGPPSALPPAAPAPQSGPPAAAAKPATALPGGSPEEQYRYAFSLMRSGDYAQAEPALKEFIAKYPSDERAGNAQYWLGESYYVRGDYQDAAASFMDTVKNYGGGPKGPDALLKLGMTSILLNKKNDACAIFKQLPAQYPKASQSIKDHAKQEAQRNKCG